MTAVREREAKQALHERIIPIDGYFIDYYSHVNHAGYVDYFAFARQNLVNPNAQVTDFDLSYKMQFVDGDRTLVTTAIQNDIQTGEQIFFQKMTHKDHVNGPSVIQTTHMLVLPENMPLSRLPSIQKDTPKGKDLLASHTDTFLIPGERPLEHTNFAPIFEAERFKILTNRGVDLKELKNDQNTLILITNVNLGIRGEFHGGDLVTTDTDIFISRRRVMTFVQTMRHEGREGYVQQISKCVFSDAKTLANREMPKFIGDKLSRKVD